MAIKDVINLARLSWKNRKGFSEILPWIIIPIILLLILVYFIFIANNTGNSFIDKIKSLLTGGG